MGSNDREVDNVLDGSVPDSGLVGLLTFGENAFHRLSQ